MRIKLHQDAEGHKSGETVDVPEGRAKFLLAEGYASTTADADGVHATSVEAKHDPRLAENREHHTESVAGEEITPSPTLAYPDPVERTNGKGDQEKGNDGKATLEKRAVKSDAAEAVEVSPKSAAKAADKADKADDAS